MRRALLVGINHYESAPLSGCIDDARRMERLLRRHDDGGVNFDTHLLTSDREMVTRARLRESLDNLFADPADVALLYFSGHGTENDLGGYLVTSDATLYNEGVALADVLALANGASHISEVAIIVDSCHSGWLGTVPARPPSRPPGAGPTPRGSVPPPTAPTGAGWGPPPPSTTCRPRCARGSRSSPPVAPRSPPWSAATAACSRNSSAAPSTAAP